jgi:hypothetical protein
MEGQWENSAFKNLQMLSENYQEGLRERQLLVDCENKRW